MDSYFNNVFLVQNSVARDWKWEVKPTGGGEKVDWKARMSPLDIRREELVDRVNTCRRRCVR